MCKSPNMTFRASAANHHGWNALVERANRSIRYYYDKQKFTNHRKGLVRNVAAALFHGITAEGHIKAFSFKLLYRRFPKLFNTCSAKNHGSEYDVERDNWKGQLNSSLNCQVRKRMSILVGDKVHFWRNQHGCLESGTVSSINKYTVGSFHDKRTKMADNHRIRISLSMNSPITLNLESPDETDSGEK